MKAGFWIGTVIVAALIGWGAYNNAKYGSFFKMS